LNIKKYLKRIGTVIMAATMAISPMLDKISGIEAKAAELVTIEHNGYARFGGRSCGKFAVNGEAAFCMEHTKDTPGSGTIAEASPYDNDLIKTILYYGWGGKGNLYTDENEGIVRTSFALNYIYTGDPAETGDPDRISGLVLAQPLLDYAQSHLIKDMNISFDKSSVEGKILAEGYQQTEGVHIEGDERNTLTFNVPASVKMHNVSTGFVGNGEVTVKGGDSIFFTSQTGEEDFSTGELVGSMGYCQPLLLRSANSNLQNVGMLRISDPPRKTSLTVKWQDKPEIKTKASDVSTEINQGHATKTVTIKDAVSYSKLIPGKEYTIKGTLMNKATGKAIQEGGKDVTSEITFVAETPDGSIDLQFTLPGSILVGKTIVAFEKLYQDEIEVASHEDLSDADQTVDYPKVEITTVAHDTETKINEAFPGEETVIRDKVSYTNLIPGKEYTVVGTLMDKTTKEPLKINGTAVTAEKAFQAKAANGSEELEFHLDSRTLAGKDLVVFEKLYFAGQEIAAHEDLEDAGQTIAFQNIVIHTIAKETESGTNEAFPKKELTIEDEVSYTNLIPGKEYVLKGTLMDKETGEPLEVDGSIVTAEKTFTAEQENGTVTVTFNFDGALLAGKKVVAFESLQYQGREIAVHADLEDEGQTITFQNPKIGTTATDKSTDTNSGYALKEVTIVDKVAYTELIVGKEYTVKGRLMDKETGKALLIGEKEVTAEKTFTADQKDGSVDLEFTFDASELKGKSVVVFETLQYQEREIAVHAELEDEGQTVTFQNPEVRTTATDKKTGTHQAEVSKNITIVDKVNYTNLVAGKEYTVKGRLMDKETGKALLIGGKEITAEKTFTADQKDGSVDLEFTFDGSELKGKSVVVFESLQYQGREIAVHADLTDEGQTVKIVKTEPPVKTGDSTNVWTYVIMGLAGLMIGAVTWKVRKKYGTR
jgi:hypothetical protein